MSFIPIFFNVSILLSFAIDAPTKQYIKLSTYAAYVLLINNHIIPHFGTLTKIEENIKLIQNLL